MIRPESEQVRSEALTVFRSILDKVTHEHVEPTQVCTGPLDLDDDNENTSDCGNSPQSDDCVEFFGFEDAALSNPAEHDIGPLAPELS